MPMRVRGFPLGTMVVPRIFGSRSKSLVHSRSLMAKTGGAPGWPSAAVIHRPKSGLIPRKLEKNWERNPAASEELRTVITSVDDIRATVADHVFEDAVLLAKIHEFGDGVKAGTAIFVGTGKVVNVKDCGDGPDFCTAAG